MTSLLRRPGAIMRLEGAVVFIASAGAFSQTHTPWWLAVLVLLVPDLLMPKAFRNHRIGSWIYDILHTYPAPAALITYAVIRDYEFQSWLAIIPLLWFLHIGFDRLLGRGARYDGAVVDDLYAKANALLQTPEMANHQLKRLGNNWGDDDE